MSRPALPLTPQSRHSQQTWRILYSRRNSAPAIRLPVLESPAMLVRQSHNSISLRLLTCVVLAGLMLLPGCVRRRLMVRSNPPGAMVYVDNQLIGTTPCATDFIYYGTREMRLVKAGYESLTINQPIPAPWYQIPPLDFVSENLTPHKIQDFRTVSYDLVPQVIVPTEQLLGRAEELRASTLQGSQLPAAPVLPPGSSVLARNSSARPRSCS
ncbi:MAG: PEGA domain-containing protein, partial [Bythopirellula sp.]|nr:PEGA domain-containing protein [Bythopirellula sp.]